jgi:hypothetical protein
LNGNLAIADTIVSKIRYFMAPHSLGKLIEWKHNDFTCVRIVIVIKTPHSLGKLIEWKPDWAVQYASVAHHDRSPLAGETN